MGVAILWWSSSDERIDKNGIWLERWHQRDLLTDMNIKIPFQLFLALLTSSAASASMNSMEVQYSMEDSEFVSTFVWDSSSSGMKPGILMVPNWMGPTEGSLEKAKKVAGTDYVVMMVDMYSTAVRPTNGEEAGAAAGLLRNDRELMRKRAAKALEVMLEQGASGAIPLDSEKIAGIGFCFGGGTVLELARSGIDLDAVVSFHGDLLSPTLEADAAKSKASVLVLHGAADPYVPQTDVQKWVSVMNDTDVDWTLVQFSGAVHSFTNPAANSAGSKYNEKVSERSFKMMRQLFDELWL